VLLRPLQWFLRPSPATLALVHRPRRVSLPVVSLPLKLGRGTHGTSGVSHLGALPSRTIAVVMIAAVVVWVAVELIRWRPELYQSMARLLRGLSLLAFLRLLLGWLRLRPDMEAWRPGAARPGDEGTAHGGRATGWLAALTDPRLAVRAAYRRYLRAAAAAGHARAAAESPTAYLQRMRPVVATAEPEARDLTTTYEQARYSGHPVAPIGVARVREALARLLRLLRVPLQRR